MSTMERQTVCGLVLQEIADCNQAHGYGPRRLFITDEGLRGSAVCLPIAKNHALPHHFHYEIVVHTEDWVRLIDEMRETARAADLKIRVLERLDPRNPKQTRSVVVFGLPVMMY